MAKRKPSFTSSGYCRVCGNRALLNMIGECEECWKAKQKEKKAQKAGVNRTQVLQDFLRPYVEQYNAGAKAKDLLLAIFKGAGYGEA